MKASTPWVECYKPNPQARLRMFCFPYAGGAAQVFRSWQMDLPSSVEVFPVQLPGRWTRIKERPFTKIESLVETLSSELLPYFDRDYVFYGHSLGALISFELARVLRTKSRLGPRLLMVSARRAPQVIRSDIPIYSLPDDEFIEQVIKRYAGVPKVVLEEPELLKILLPALRADLEMFETYKYVHMPPLSCPIVAFGGKEDPNAKEEELGRWREQTTEWFDLKTFGGDHFFLQSSQKELLENISFFIGRLY